MNSSMHPMAIRLSMASAGPARMMPTPSWVLSVFGSDSNTFQVVWVPQRPVPNTKTSGVDGTAVLVVKIACASRGRCPVARLRADRRPQARELATAIGNFVVDAGDVRRG